MYKKNDIKLVTIGYLLIFCWMSFTQVLIAEKEDENSVEIIEEMDEPIPSQTSINISKEHEEKLSQVGVGLILKGTESYLKKADPHYIPIRVKKKIEEELKTTLLNEKEEYEKKNSRPHIDNIPLTDAQLDYIWKSANDADIPYTWLLAIASQESNYNPNNIGKANPKDRGLFQINENTGNYLKNLMGLENVDYFNLEQNTDMAVFNFVLERDRWEEKGIVGQQLIEYATISYHMGGGGASKFLRNNHSSESQYLNLVKKKHEVILGDMPQ